MDYLLVLLVVLLSTPVQHSTDQ